MKQNNVLVAVIVWASVSIVGLSGCGGSSNSGGGGGGGTPPTITSFSAGAATIEAGSSTSLTGVFSGGTGVITPGNIAASSGTAVSVTPAATTTYTLTVTSSGGLVSSQTSMVTVDPVPTITSFSAGAATIEAGSSTSLTANFAGGTGMITPGNIAVTSGVAVNVSPTATTPYTLTVTPPVGTVNATMMTTVTVDPVPTITSFSAGAATIEAGSSTSLTANFAGGTGMIAPGNIAVTSGVAVNVSPTATTQYTLTVTPPVGTVNATMMTTVTVDPVPTISSFSANPTTITTTGGSSALTANFTGGTGVVTPGNLSISSGTPINVTPTTTTTYTLTVTPPVGTVNATQTVTVTVSTGVNISSFTASPTTIEAGSNTYLTGYFTGGTGVVTPGNYSATSGTAIILSPTTTTTYTLTVTPTGGGTPSTKTATVTVYPVPAISSFTASSTNIVAGNSVSLTADFTGGTGVITPGNLAATSGTPINVSPTATTTYTLTVTPPVGSVDATQTVTVNVATGVTITQSSTGTAVSNKLLGLNMAVWYDFTDSGAYTAGNSPILSAFQATGITALRWPGGSTSDDYHWNGSAANPANGVAPVPSTCEGAYQDSNTNYLNFMQDLEFGTTAPSGGYDVALTADYGTNEACTGGGDPNEPANWVKYALANGGTVSHVTVGNEEYGSWEEDLHASPHNATTYASAVSGASGYYTLIKAQSPNTLVGVVVDANNSCCTAGWDTTVLSNAKGYYDFVEFHYYPQNPGGENDTFLVQQAAQQFTSNINTIKSELTTAGTSGTPIYVGEMGSVSSNPGKQSMSITQGLYAGQLLGEMMNDGVSRATWWIGFGNCNGTAGYMGTSTNPIYGWQDFGAYNIFSDGPTTDPTCTPWGSIGTVSPTSVAYQMFSNVAVTGEHVQAASVAGDTTDVRAYAASHSGGTALVLFNLNETTAENVVVSLSSESNSPGITEYTYDKEMYDYTNTNCALDPSCTVDPNHSYANVDWVGPTTTSLGAQALPLTVTLQPWSMNVLIIQ